MKYAIGAGIGVLALLFVVGLLNSPSGGTGGLTGFAQLKVASSSNQAVTTTSGTLLATSTGAQPRRNTVTVTTFANPVMVRCDADKAASATEGRLIAASTTATIVGGELPTYGNACQVISVGAASATVYVEEWR